MDFGLMPHNNPEPILQYPSCPVKGLVKEEEPLPFQELGVEIRVP